MSTDTPTEVEDEVLTPDDVFDAAFDEIDPEPEEQPRDADGKFASTATDAAAETPAEDAETPEDATPAEGTETQDAPVETPTTEAERRAFKVKLDHEEHEVDLDAMWADEAKRKELKERIEKGYVLDRERERHTQALAQSRQESFEQGRGAVLKWLESQGQIRRNPLTNGFEFVPQAASPAQNGNGQAATPDPAAQREALEKVATYGDENDPAAQVRAIRQLAKMDAEHAASEKFKVVEQWRAQQQQAAQEAHVKQQRESALAQITGAVDQAIEARAKSFDGPDRDRQMAAVKALALRKAQTDAKTLEEVLSVVTQAAADLDARREYYMKQAAIPASKTPTPTPSLEGAPSGVSATSTKGKKPKGMDDDEWWDEAIDSSSA